MLLDRENQFTGASGQVVTANANSTDVIDQGAARSVGSGRPVYLNVVATAKSGTAPGIRFQLVGSDLPDLSTPTVIFDSGVLTDPPLGFLARAPIPHHTPKRYIGILWITSGTTPSFTLTAGLAMSVQTSPDTN